MGKKWVLVDDNKYSSPWGTIIALLLVAAVVLILSPGIFITSILDAMINMQSKTIWGLSILFSGAAFAFCCWKYSWKHYLIASTIISLLMLIIELLFEYPLFSQTLVKMLIIEG